jgi:murein DD-endopeptidase MepM/ murein hydrolase activator NlpD
MAADTLNLLLEYVVTEDTTFIVRVQPELLKKGEYTLTISPGPSLAFPIPQNIKSSIISLFGTGRDNGGRKHEGIDILAPKHSTAIASANGVVTRVNENALGGKVIFLRPDNTLYSLYYAHLDSQIAKEGQRVKIGDILGLTGNTGNAKFTVSHLHFGIYTNNNVALDPLYFVKNDYKESAKLSVPLNNLNTWMRSIKNAKLYFDQAVTTNFITLEENTLMQTDAGTANFYRVILPDGKRGFVTATSITPAIKPLKRLTIKRSLSLFSTPDPSGLQKKLLAPGEKINVLATFNDYYFISDKENIEGWILKKQL